MIIKQAKLVEFFIDDVHDVLRHHSLLQSLPKLLLNGVFVLLLQAQLLLNDLQLLLQEVLPVGLLDLLFHLQNNKEKIDPAISFQH